MASVQTLPLDYELTVYSGTTFKREFRWLPDGAAALDFTDWTASMMIGLPMSSTPVITLSTATTGITLSAGGQIVITMTPSQTAALKPGVMMYSLDLTDAAGGITRFLRGRVSVVNDVGRSSYAAV